MIVKDMLWFHLPKDQQLQFPAVAMLQYFVATYDARMKGNDPSGGTAVYQLEYGVNVPQEDWQLFLDAGLTLVQPPLHIGAPTGELTMEIDMREERLERFGTHSQHACQLYGKMCGEESIPVPKIRRVKGSINGRWGTLPSTKFYDALGWKKGSEGPFVAREDITVTQLLQAKDEEWRGIIGYMGKETYLAAAMGLPVIELYPRTMPVTWLSKWANRGYRMVIDSEPYSVQRQLKSAIGSIEEMLRRGIPCFPDQAPRVG